jgi:hypothetical protein
MSEMSDLVLNLENVFRIWINQPKEFRMRPDPNSKPNSLSNRIIFKLLSIPLVQGSYSRHICELLGIVVVTKKIWFRLFLKTNSTHIIRLD